MKMKSIFSLIFLLIFSCIAFDLSAQVGINESNLSPASSAMLDINSSNKGLLIPRMSTESRNAIPSPATGLLIYNTSTDLFNYFDGSYWFAIEKTAVSPNIGTISAGGGVAISAQQNILPDNSAMLDASDPVRGFLLTRTTPGAINAPADGLIIYDISDNLVKYFYGTEWYPVCAVSTGITGATGTQASVGVGINNTNASPHPSAILDVSSPNKGVLIPRLTTAERDAILPATGLTIFNISAKTIEYYNGSSWARMNIILPASVSITSTAVSVCEGTEITVTATAVNGGGSPAYQWKVNNQPVTGATNVTYTFTPVSNVTVTCVMTSSNPCATGNPATSNPITITVNPNLQASVTIAAVPAGAICAGTSVTFTATPVNGGINPAYQWFIGASQITGATNSTFTSPTLGNGTAISVVMTSGPVPCLTGSPATSNPIVMIVNPIPSADPVGNLTYCDGVITAPIAFNGPVAGTTFTWTNNNPSIGLGANGTGNIPSFTASNNGITAIIATITVIPAANGCTGPPMSFTLTINPTPGVNQVANLAYCNGVTTSAITFGGPVAGTTFSWTNSAPSIGLAASGTGNISAFVATNNGPAPAIATITVTPAANGCIGIPSVFTITVYPTTTVNQVANTFYCNGAATAAITITSPVAGTSFTWTNNTPSIGLAASGTGSIPSFTATNPGFSTVIATITITPSANGCIGTPSTFTITLYPTPVVNPIGNMAFCNGATTSVVTIGSPVAGTTFAWTNNNPTVGLAASGTGNIPLFTATNAGTAPTVATITVTPTANGCTGTNMVFTITVNPTATVNPVGNESYCNGSTTAAIILGSPVAGSTFAWTNSLPSIGLAAAGTGNIPSFTSTNQGTAIEIANIDITPAANGCTGTSSSFLFTVYPTPAVNPIGNATYCNGASTSAVTVGSPVAGTTFTWSNNTPSIGLAATGTGDIPNFTAINNGTAPVIATITVIPAANGCIGLPLLFTITVFPTATVNPVNNSTYCNGAVTSVVAFSSPVAGSTFAWSNSTPSIGLAANGTGPIPSFTAINTGTAPEVATITITPTANGCQGIPSTFTITVYPTSTVNPVNNETYCNGATTAAITFGSPVAGTAFAWTNNTPSIGLAGAGAGNIAPFNAINTGTVPVVASIAVTPTANGCTGTPLSFTITVYPTTTVNPVGDATYCNGATTSLVNPGSPVAGTTFSWTNDTPSVGLAANGTGVIPSFTATNTGTAPEIATITVTPTANGCVGTPRVFTITVFPTATVNLVNNETYCNGTLTTSITFGSPVAGTTFAWTNSVPSIGLSATGTGIIPSFTATNPGTAPVIATITVTPTANACVGTPMAFTITVYPTATVNPINNVTYCNGATASAVTFSSPVAGTTFAWTNNTPSIGLASTGTGNTPTFAATNSGTAPEIATITVTPTANGCIGTPIVFTITVYPTATVNPVNNETHCNGATAQAITFGSPVAGTTFVWTNNTPSIGFAGSGTGSIPSFTALNTGTSPVIATITVIPTANGCTGTPLTFTITVFPTSTVNQLADVTYCDGGPAFTTVFGSPVAGTTYTWTNNTPSIGLAASGTGDIPSFTATNAGTAPVIATITVTPAANGCIGTPMTFSITVFPTATVNPIGNVAYCNGDVTTAIVPSSPVAGTSFAWTNSIPSIGLAASGTGSIPSFIATNTGTATVNAVIAITPTANGCTGTLRAFIFSVYPTSTVNPISNKTHCNGATTPAITIVSPVAGSTFAWTNDTPSIGLAASGTGNIPSFPATNTGTTPVIATITVTPTANGCTGIPLTFTITVNPTTTVNAVNNGTYCNGAATTAITFGSPVAGTTFAWTNSAPSIGLAASGAGNIASFTATNTGTVQVVATITVTPTANGCTGTPLSFTITVNPSLPVSITVTPSANNVCANTLVVYNTTIVNGGTTPLYQWKLNGTNITGATNAMYQYAPLNGALISCVLTSNALCATGSPATSNVVTMNVIPKVFVKALVTATAYAMMPNTSVTFTASVVNGGTNPTYQWKKNGTNITGATTSTYTYVPLNLDKVSCTITSNLTVACLTNNPATSSLSMIVYVAGSPCTAAPTVVYGGKTYNTVQIGTQCWMREDLDIGTRVDITTTQTNNAVIEKYCYNDSTYNCDIYGGLYQWNEMMQYVTTPGTQGICPTGWHIPTEAESITLATFVGGAGTAGGFLKEAGTGHFRSPNTSATNTYGFTLLPTGYSFVQATPLPPIYSNIYQNGYFHTSTDYALPNGPVFRSVSLSSAVLGSFYNSKTTGHPVRCLKN